MNVRTLAMLAMASIAAAVAWPLYVTTREAQAAGPTPAPVVADYLQRDRTIAFYERAVRRHPDQIVTRLLASQYAQRFRETGDLGDVLRAQRLAERSLAMQPRFNIGAEMALGSALLSLHRFRDALRHAEQAVQIEPFNTAAIAQAASMAVEVGRYDDAARRLHSLRPAGGIDVPAYTALARYDEVAGKLQAARSLIDLAMAQTDSIIDNPAEARAWFHFRAGELAWSGGDAHLAERRFREALDIFPDYPRAWNGLARLCWAQRRWKEALQAATRAAQRVPLPETFGYKADAQRALGDETAARGTEDLIGAITRIGNALGVNDRALALYFADHGVHLNEAVAIARRDVAARDDVFAEDTLGWALARSGRWREARAVARRALRLGTEDARLQYHAAVIAMESGDCQEAVRGFRAALALNPHFHPTQADDARRRLDNCEAAW